MQNKFAFSVLCYALTHNVYAQKTPTATIEHDPFQQPQIAKPEASANSAEQKSGQATDTSRPKLIMTLRAGKNSMANIGGRIIKLGERFDDYVLTEVGERSATLVKHGKIIHLNLDDYNDK